MRDYYYALIISALASTNNNIIETIFRLPTSIPREHIIDIIQRGNTEINAT
jgi:hypothetical protein